MADRTLSRDDVLGGLGARRAWTVLHAIRSRTASRVARSRRSLGGYAGRGGAAGREQEFFAALAAGRDLPRKPTIQDLERYAADWAPLVPQDPGLRLAVARLILADEPVTQTQVPRLRAALGIDGTAAEDLFAASLPTRERLRWRSARLAERLERLPPFWIAFALTLTECVGAGILALPVALAGIGPLGAVVVLVVFGLINVITVAALVEALTRTGSMRYGTAYLDSLVADHLGPAAARLMGLSLFALNAAVLLVALIGFGAVLESATGVPLLIWAALLFAGNLVLLRRERLDATVASALVVGAVNILLVIALSVVALTHALPANFERVNVPLLDGRPVDTDVLVLIFGVVLLAFFGHTSAANSAKVVLERDPTGRALLWGNVAALGAATLLYSLTALAFTGALERSALEGSEGTALEPLAERAGVIVHVLGTAFAVLAVGMGSVYACLGLYNQVVELRPLPNRDRRFLVGAAAPLGLFALLVWLVAAGRESFTAPLGYAGALTIPLLGGLFPMLLVVSSRRRGELVPGAAPRLVGHGVTAVAIGVVFAAAVLAHALVIWDAPLERAAAGAVFAGMLLVAVDAWRRGAFRRRVVIELRREPERDLGFFAVTATGRALHVPVELDGRSADLGGFERFSALRTARVALPADAPEELSVWSHRVSGDGVSTPVPASVTIDDHVVTISLTQKEDRDQ